MKLRLLALVGLVTCFFTSAHAQTSTNDVAFVDEQGNVINNNTTIVLNNVDYDIFNPGWKKIGRELFVQNRSGKSQIVTLHCTIKKIEEGEVKVCALKECSISDQPGSYVVGSPTLFSSTKKEVIDVEHNFKQNEKCEITLHLTTKEEGADAEKQGSTLTIKFDTDPTGVASVTSSYAGSYDVFNTQGTLLYRQLTSLSNLPKGLYIVKQTGSKEAIKKFVVR